MYSGTFDVIDCNLSLKVLLSAESHTLLGIFIRLDSSRIDTLILFRIISRPHIISKIYSLTFIAFLLTFFRYLFVQIRSCWGIVVILQFDCLLNIYLCVYRFFPFVELFSLSHGIKNNFSHLFSFQLVKRFDGFFCIFRLIIVVGIWEDILIGLFIFEFIQISHRLSYWNLLVDDDIVDALHSLWPLQFIYFGLLLLKSDNILLNFFLQVIKILIFPNPKLFYQTDLSRLPHNTIDIDIFLDTF